MRKAVSVGIGFILCVAVPQWVFGVEMTWEYSVQVSATVQASPPGITLHWPQDQYMLPSSYTVYRKAPSDSSWGTGTTLPGTATSYTDAQINVGTPYEYQIVKATSQYTGYGYLYSGVNVAMTDSRGKLLLVVDNTYAAALTNELGQLQQDLVGDGWAVIRVDVGRNDSVVSVKDKIKAQYTADPTNVKCVFLFGHVPVPYSGDIVPDGHIPNHQGAWPCDGFYGDMDGTWTDTTVNDTGADDARNHNTPGDGKFDQSTFPAPIKLMVGRVDLANLPGELWYGGPTTIPSELYLLRNYLNKDHKFRTKQFDLPQRGIVGDFIGERNGESFAASGYRNFSAFFGANNITNVQTQGAWTPVLKNAPYLWSYGCGAGSLTSVEGLGNSDAYYNLITSELYTNDIKSVFTLFFGSWMGDWDAKDDIMRCVLAMPSYGLACAWSGRPHWFLQHMGLGETLGFGARLTQNNGANGLYQNQINTAAGQIHIALMGDPTLRLHIVAPPTHLSAVTLGNAVNLSWTPSTDPVLGYHVYRASGANGSFVRLTTSPVSANSYTDSTGAGLGQYMVRAVSLQTSPSGSYFNPSLGAFVTASNPGRLPILISTSRVSNGVQLTWSTQPSTVYRVQTRSLAQGTWTDLSGSITASGSTTTWTDTNAFSVPNRFYRIIGS
ncbi:MAG TPA: fibronectin type III domain-containing protein [Verrucomicrobiae bacterium]|nr:fibronectin type III domain-containing protein [Verrucomicrobiae bacterium]